jgi:hypothetical protein
MVWGVQRGLLAAFILIFLVGFMSNIVISSYRPITEQPVQLTVYEVQEPTLSDRISEDQIHVTKNKITLDIKDASWARFTDTKSMEPFIYAGANSIEVKAIPADIQIGDVVSFRYKNSIIIHRVIEMKEDALGRYFVTKGDNLPKPDPIKVRDNQLLGVVVAVIY